MIRDTYGNQKNWPHNVTVTLIFFIGELPKNKIQYQNMLQYEFGLYKDIVQNNYSGMCPKASCTQPFNYIFLNIFLKKYV